jgi:hypothetical protein
VLGLYQIDLQAFRTRCLTAQATPGTTAAMTSAGEQLASHECAEWYSCANVFDVSVVLAGGLMTNTREMEATIAGAVIGGVAGYLFFTDRGRSMRRQIESALEDFSRELMRFQQTVQHVEDAANEGCQLLIDTLREGQKPPAWHRIGQTFPH